VQEAADRRVQIRGSVTNSHPQGLNTVVVKSRPAMMQPQHSKSRPAIITQRMVLCSNPADGSVSVRQTPYRSRCSCQTREPAPPLRCSPRCKHSTSIDDTGRQSDLQTRTTSSSRTKP
jgi:hypothetical protein